MTNNWKHQIQLASKLVMQQVNTKVYKIAWELFTSVIDFTPSPTNPGPYAKGLLVNAWFPAEKGASPARSSNISPNGSDSRSRVNAMAANGTEFLEKDGKITLTNNTPYAYRAEYLGWPESDNPMWKNRGPYRMVARSLQKIAAKYKTK
jgi:hypothetical protein